MRHSNLAALSRHLMGLDLKPSTFARIMFEAKRLADAPGVDGVDWTRAGAA